MENYTHLSMAERCLINTFLSMKVSKSTIAKRTGRHRSTIYRELERNAQYGCYMPSVAHELARERHPHPNNKIQTNQELNNFVLEGLEKGWSPEQISGRMKKEKKKFYVCAESIYRYIYRNKNLGLYKLLPNRKSKRRQRSGRNTHQKRSHILKRNICYRPAEISTREKLGHWEGDTIRFPRSQKTCVTTLVERKSRFVCLRKNKDKKSETIMDHIFNAIKSTPKKIWGSLTLDQGSEFMSFRKIERHTKCKIFFCDPHSPWQRGSNENMNGRLRRYLPKDLKIDKISQEELDEIAIRANDTPRKCLGYFTPNEVISQHWKAFCRASL
jgi:IS30 family transposase